MASDGKIIVEKEIELLSKIIPEIDDSMKEKTIECVNAGNPV